MHAREDPSLRQSATTITTEDGRQVGGGTNGKRERFRIYRGHFDDHLSPDPERERRDHHKKRSTIECVWGWAIICHKSQGSQFENVVVFDDGLGRLCVYARAAA